jgi:hypothetical protein
VHPFPSSQTVPVSGSVEHCPVVELHTPTWHWSEDGQLVGLLPVHTPFAQMSVCVHALPSLQGAVLLVFTHPVAGLQLSSVQTLLSSQFGAGPPTQDPPEQVSLVVHAFPSLHVVPSAFGVCEHAPVVGLQIPPLLHWSPGQGVCGPGTHAPPMHISPFVHAFPSVHGVVSGNPAHDVTGVLPAHPMHW